MVLYDSIISKCNTKTFPMQELLEIEVWEFEWDEDNESHCARHGVTPSVAEEVKGGTPLFFRNKRKRTGTHMMIGPDVGGRFWTVVILETSVEGRWRPITGWPSDTPELRRYNNAATSTLKTR